MDSPIRVLHIVRGLKQGGIQNFLINVYKNIDRNIIQFDFLVSEKGDFDNVVLQLGGRIFEIPYITEIGVKKYQEELSNFFSMHTEYKIVHSHLNQLSGIPLEIAKEFNIPVRIAHAHTTQNNNNFLLKIYKNILQFKINKNATVWFACSEMAAKKIFREKSENTQIVFNGIDVQKFIFSEAIRKKIRYDLKIGDNVTVLGHIGRLSSVKNHLFLLDIFKEYLKLDKNCILLLIGDGELKEKIKKKIYNERLENKVLMLGNKTDAYKYYSSFDIFVFPSKYEGLGISLIEAQVNGLYCYASTTIPPEVRITNRIKFISLKKNPKYWANIIYNGFNKKYYRYESIDVVKNKYSINKVAQLLQDEYIKLYNKNKEEK